MTKIKKEAETSSESAEMFCQLGLLFGRRVEARVTVAGLVLSGGSSVGYWIQRFGTLK